MAPEVLKARCFCKKDKNTNGGEDCDSNSFNFLPSTTSTTSINSGKLDQNNKSSNNNNSNNNNNQVYDHGCQSYDFKSDIWSLGVTLFELLLSEGTSCFPFTGSNREEILQRIKTG